MTVPSFARFARRVGPAVLALAAVAAPAADDGPRLIGDVGPGVFARQAIVRGQSADASLLPYVFAQYGRVFGRIDTFGVKTLPVGWGHLEVSTRILQDGLDPEGPTAGLAERKAARPLGLSTFQVTPWGAFALTALRDLGESKGSVVDANWTGKARLAPWLTIYPQLGAEHLSARYVDYQYGVRPGETGFAPYTAGSATNPYVALYTDTPLGERVALTLSLRQKWLGRGIADSPLVERDTRWNAFAAVTYRFE